MKARALNSFSHLLAQAQAVASAAAAFSVKSAERNFRNCVL